ncbi:MAG: hypothetical protein PHY45_12615 [Rhodocyclaceae bacterium]|nr:hypothetical protein [Rhodocyclaceae bacterium]
MAGANSRGELDSFVLAVQRNCDITDARHAREMTMCNYLLEMREFYRWDRGLPFGTAPPHADVSAWLAAREALWEELQGEEFAALPLGEAHHDPFASDAINRELRAHGMIYGAGIGRFGKPHFFLGPLLGDAMRDGVRVLVCDREVARDMSTLPAALQGNTIVVRREALRQWLWERVEAWDVKRNAGALQAALDAYGFGADAAAAIERMLETETETLVLHELGEHAAGRQLGPAWEELLSVCRSKRAEVLLRALRDNLADCLSTLPTLLSRETTSSLHFWFANFNGMRLELFPGLAAAYAAWNRSGNAAAMTSAIDAGRAHWRRVAERMLMLFAQWGPEVDGEIERLSHKVGEISLS